METEKNPFNPQQNAFLSLEFLFYTHSRAFNKKFSNDIILHHICIIWKRKQNLNELVKNFENSFIFGIQLFEIMFYISY